MKDRERYPYLHALFEAVQQLFEEQPDSAAFAGGNVLFRFYDNAEVSWICSGASTGFHTEKLSDAEYQLVVVCEKWFLDGLLDPSTNDSYANEDTIVGAGLQMGGDPKVLEKWVNLLRPKNAMSVRLQTFGSSIVKKKAKRLQDN